MQDRPSLAKNVLTSMNASRPFMDTLSGFWTKGTLWVLLLIVVALALVAFVFHRIRPRKPPPAIRAPDMTWNATDQNLDSSHIGGPIFPQEEPGHAGNGRAGTGK